MKKIAILSAAVLVLPVVVFGQAALRTDASVNATVKVTDIDADGEVDVSAQSGVETSRESNSGMSSGRQAGTLEVKVLPVSASATATEATGRTQADVNISLSVKRSGLQVGTTTVKVISAGQVSIASEAELKALVESVIASDANVKVIKIENLTTTVDYQYEGKFLGIIPIKPILKASVGADGNVSVKYPWYSMFVKRVSAVDETTLNAEAASRRGIVSYTEPRMNVQAKLMLSLTAALKAKTVAQ